MASLPTKNQRKALTIVGIEWVWFTVGSGLLFFTLFKNWDYLIADIKSGDRDLPVCYVVAGLVLLVTLGCNLILTQGIVRRYYKFVFAWYLIHIIMYVFTAILFCLFVCLIVKFGFNFMPPLFIVSTVIFYRTYCLVIIIRFMKEILKDQEDIKSNFNNGMDNDNYDSMKKDKEKYLCSDYNIESNLNSYI